MNQPLTRSEVSAMTSFIWWKAISGITKEQEQMFSQVVYKIDDHKYKVESTDAIGNIGKPIYYKSLEGMPADLRDKVKQLMWTSKNDQSITEELGVRIGENIFWII